MAPEEHEEWFLNLSSLEYHRLTKKWVEKNYEVPANLEGYDQWLYVHIPDVEFRKAMQCQLDFFASKYEETV